LKRRREGKWVDCSLVNNEGESWSINIVV
jgi:hypothetical protein